MRFAEGLWLWLVVSRQVKQVLGFVFSQCDGSALADAWRGAMAVLIGREALCLPTT